MTMTIKITITIIIHNNPILSFHLLRPYKSQILYRRSRVPFAKTNFVPTQKSNSFLANTFIILTASSPGSLSILHALSAGSNYKEKFLEVVTINRLIKCTRCYCCCYYNT
ncbi:hypothetical protein Q3G72_000560 [Acer saccharum]|nr:hypothetical protein Q3G72_000560 [Acer saccharum]